MTIYEYGRIDTLDKKLKEADVNQELIDKIMKDGEMIRRSTKPAKKADWMREAIRRMDELLDKTTRYNVRQSCACCLGGRRLKISRGIAMNNESFEDRLKAANNAHYVFGHSVTQDNDGKILVRFGREGLAHYRCVCLPKAAEPISITYCYCCGGHVKHHLQIALNMELSCHVLTSALSSKGGKTCSFEFTILSDRSNI